ncbi:hypothetical protein [Streptomyces halobius]|uniref:Uncharacterized protein n=1 Tax=Streptomyces halobius TaxID=2879846 RepID=A0ABY4M925_9ACTN|nr:hypothetical protein [Streptomyces halobius]UQA93907.1 hypothetical protein K9S39_20335 [Streptomyces halobius]
MGSLRNPIGPLPSSIYWRRRAVALAIVALLILLVVWALNLGGNTGKTANEGKGAKGSGPAASITPGPSGTGPAISQKPGGRDTSGGGGESGSDSGGGAGASGGGAGSGGAGDGSGSGGSLPIGEGPGSDVVPAGSPLPNCTSGTGKLTLRSVKDSYRPDEKPKFELIVKNTAGSACKVDLGRKATVLTITDDTADDDRVWASDDCPSGTGSALLQVPAKDSVKRTIEWDRRASAPQCATPSAAAVPAGKYRIEAEVPGLSPVHTYFVLAKG